MSPVTVSIREFLERFCVVVWRQFWQVTVCHIAWRSEVSATAR